MLQELYGVYNPTTGSIFTSFATRTDIEKETVLNDLMALFIACDKVYHSSHNFADVLHGAKFFKYNLLTIKQKAAEAIIDRLRFVHPRFGTKLRVKASWRQVRDCTDGWKKFVFGTDIRRSCNGLDQQNKFLIAMQQATSNMTGHPM